VSSVPIFESLRSRILSIDATEAGITPSGRHPRVWAVLMEMGFPEGAATLVTLADGTTSLYTSSGGGTIGAGEHEVVAQETMRFLEVVADALDRFQPTTTFPLPITGRVRINVRAFDGGFTAEAPENELGEGTHPLSPVFYAGHEVISRMREIEESMQSPSSWSRIRACWQAVRAWWWSLSRAGGSRPR